MKSGQFSTGTKRNEARLALAYSGATHFAATQWLAVRPRRWVLDYINHGTQSQRVAHSPVFTRLSNVAALYAPGLEYHELQEQGKKVAESYIQFELTGRAALDTRVLTRPHGYCHIQDPDQLLGDRLRRLADVLFHRRPRFEWIAEGVFLELIGLVLQSSPLGPGLRVVRAEGAPRGDDLVRLVEEFVRTHAARSITVKDLAAQAKLSEARFARTYRALAGEAPYRTVLRVKIETAKRLLLQDQLSVKETAFRLGFSSEFHFSRAFKNLEGSAPSVFRNALCKQGGPREPPLSSAPAGTKRAAPRA